MVSVLWFRHGLRLHDNPALHAALENCSEFYPIFIFDGESAGTKRVGYNRMKYLTDSLSDLDQQFKKCGGRLFVFKGDPKHIFRRLKEEVGVKRICFEQDCEPIWSPRDQAVKSLCAELGIECIEKVSHTLWDPKLVIRTNGGIPPLTYEMFTHTVSVIGQPPRPVANANLKVKFGQISDNLMSELGMWPSVPQPDDFGLVKEAGNRTTFWIGGETEALKLFNRRLRNEGEALAQGILLMNHALPNLTGPSNSLSPALRFGCLSVRKFYWAVHDLFTKIHKIRTTPSQSITGQLIWREYFYTMSVDNPHYAEMSDSNRICLQINWLTASDSSYSTKLDRWKKGMTGYPFIDAAMRQLISEGWIHHVARNAVACFLTRGDLWISWEDGLDHFLKYLLDADWSVCAGNWMWVSSSAFEKLLDCSNCICPVNFGRRLDPYGIYVNSMEEATLDGTYFFHGQLGVWQGWPALLTLVNRPRAATELHGMGLIFTVRKLPIEYLYEPWKAPIAVQEEAECVIGVNYPERIVDHKTASSINRKKMEDIRTALISKIPHCCPSNNDEIRQFMWLPSHSHDHSCAV